MKLGEKAKGSLGAKTVEQDKIADSMAEVLKRPDSRFYVAVGVDAIPCSCVDGRCPDRRQKLSPNTAGGTLSLWVAARLIDLTEVTFPEFLQCFDDRNLPIGGHTDEHAGAEKSGCGANDKLSEILSFINQNYETVVDVLNLIEQDTDKKVARRMADKAIKLSSGVKNENPVARLDAMRHAGGEISTLVGNHGELVAVINMVAGTTLDRFTLAEEYDENMTFNVDYWSFAGAARATLDALGQEPTDDQVAQFVTALTLYNIATTFALGSPNLRVVVRD
jgi:hypothetical protein